MIAAAINADARWFWHGPEVFARLRHQLGRFRVPLVFGRGRAAGNLDTAFRLDPEP